MGTGGLGAGNKAEALGSLRPVCGKPRYALGSRRRGNVRRRKGPLGEKAGAD